MESEHSSSTPAIPAEPESAPMPVPVTLVEHRVVDHRARSPEPEPDQPTEIPPAQPAQVSAAAIDSMRTPQEALKQKKLREDMAALATYGAAIVRTPRAESEKPEHPEGTGTRKAAGKMKAADKDKAKDKGKDSGKKGRGRHQGHPDSDVEMKEVTAPPKPSPRKEKKRKPPKSASVVGSGDDEKAAEGDEPPRKKSRGRDTNGDPVKLGCDRCTKARIVCTRVNAGNKVACDQCAAKKTGCSLADPSRAGPSTRTDPAIASLQVSQSATAQWQLRVTNILLDIAQQQDRHSAEVVNNNRFVIALSEQLEDTRRRMNVGVNAMRLWSQVHRCLNWSAPNGMSETF